MREILFRGKRIDNGEWDEGFYAETPYIDKYGTLHIRNIMATINGKYVIPETVGQYTGLKDGNCKRIFEGDVISLKNETCEDSAIVSYKGSEFFLEGNMGGIFFREALHFFKCEVIGNIHDDIELPIVKFDMMMKNHKDNLEKRDRNL